jgi:F-type H+-transporting ATPase subunit delta
LRQLRAMVQASPDLLRLIRSPILSRDEQSKGIGALAERAGLSPLVRDFLAVVARTPNLPRGAAKSPPKCSRRSR